MAGLSEGLRAAVRAAARVVVLAVVWAGCGEERAGDAWSVRDSAGIRIVENARPAWEDGTGWTVAAAAVLSIGVAEGDSTQVLDRVVDARLVGPDTVLVVDGGSSQLRWYDADGRLLHAVGRAGAGPGEFSRYGPGRLCVLAGGDLVVADPIQQRAHVFTRSGAFSRLLAVRLDAAFPSVQGCFEDGTLLGWHSEQSPERIPGRVNPTTFVWTRLGGDGTTLGELARLPGPQQYLLDQGDGSATYHTIPFTVGSTAAAAPAGLYVAAGADPVIERRTLDGSVDRLVRWMPARVRSEDVYERYRAHVIGAQAQPDRQRQWARFFDVGVARPEFVAAVQGLLLDDEGVLWSKRYRLPWDTAGVWDVFDADGRWLGGVALPDRLDVRQIGRDFVLGIHRDTLGVERVRMHRLDRRQPR
jgi:hypothetical protein